MFGSETCEICPKVLRNVYVKFTESSKPVQEDPYGPMYGPIRAHIGAHKGPNPDRVPTRTGPQTGPGPNPARSSAPRPDLA